MATWSLRPLAFPEESARVLSRSAENRSDVVEFNKGEVGRDANPPYNHGGVIVVTSAWLAFYIIAAIHHFVASGN